MKTKITRYTHPQSSIQEMDKKETSAWKDKGGIQSCSAYSIIPELEVWRIICKKNKKRYLE